MEDVPPLLTLQDCPLTPDQLVEAAAGTQLEVDVLSAVSAPSLLTCVRSAAGWGIDITTLNAHVGAIGGIDPRCVALLIVDRPGASNICGAFLDRRVALFMPVGTEIAASISPGLAYATVVLPGEHWRDALALAGASAPAGPLAVDLSTESADVLLSKARRLARTLAEDGTGEQRVPEALIDYVAAFARACRFDGAGRLDLDHATRLKQAWAAQEYLRHHLDEDISIEQLCRILHVSRRQLEYAFRTVFDVSPRTFQQNLRLNESRRRLMTARDRGLTVTQVAMDVGISHLGRYAAYYRRLFGETPRQTLERAGRT